jgi:hypothetical protein
MLPDRGNGREGAGMEIRKLEFVAAVRRQQIQDWGEVMKKSLWLVLSICGACSVSGCGGSSTPPPLITVQMSTAALALDVNQTAPVTATAINAPTNQGFDWVLSCGGGDCGTITAHTASGALATFSAPAAPLSIAVTITAKLTSLTNSGTTSVTVSAPPTVATTSPIQAASLSTPYSLQLGANGGAGALTWALGGSTSLPDTLALSPTGMITGTPTGSGGSFTFKVHVTDSGSPQMTSPDVPLSITVGGPPISLSLSITSAVVGLHGSKNFFATVLNDQQNGNVDWTLSLNSMPCTVTVCGSTLPASTASGAPTTYTAPASVPPENITLTATTVDGTPPATSSAAITISAHGFTATGSMATARAGHTATLLKDGRVFVTGGGMPELFDPKGTFTSMESTGTTGGQTATLLKDGRLLLTGGGAAEIFDPISGTFTPTKGLMVSTRRAYTATLLTDGQVVLIGGDGPGETLATAELFDPVTQTFTPTGSMKVARFGHTATLLKDGRVLVMGGAVHASVPPTWLLSLDTAEIFDPTSETFSQTGNLGSARTAHAATLLKNGNVLVTGGLVYSTQAGSPIESGLSSAELFDPTKGSFAPTASMTAERGGHSATLLGDGTVLVAGGNFVYIKYGPMRFLLQSNDSAEVFDPTGTAVIRTGDMETPRSYHTSTLLQDGRVLVTGGSVYTGQFVTQLMGPVLSTAELYQ